MVLTRARQLVAELAQAVAAGRNPPHPAIDPPPIAADMNSPPAANLNPPLVDPIIPLSGNPFLPNTPEPSELSSIASLSPPPGQDGRRILANALYRDNLQLATIPQLMIPFRAIIL